MQLAFPDAAESLEAFQENAVDPVRIWVGNKWGEAGLKG